MDQDVCMEYFIRQDKEVEVGSHQAYEMAATLVTRITSFSFQEIQFHQQHE